LIKTGCKNHTESNEYTLEFKKSALKNILKIAKNSTLKNRLQEILNDIKSNPYSSNFMFERLKHNYQGYCSKRLTKFDRIIYQVFEDKVEVLIISILGHYDDK
jgi:toxin YoeB